MDLCTKVKYVDELTAVKAWHRIRSQHLHPVRRAYRCKTCGMWHLTKCGQGAPSAQLVMLQRIANKEEQQ